jgi:hypothetical protein
VPIIVESGSPFRITSASTSVDEADPKIVWFQVNQTTSANVADISVPTHMVALEIVAFVVAVPLVTPVADFPVVAPATAASVANAFELPKDYIPYLSRH